MRRGTTSFLITLLLEDWIILDDLTTNKILFLNMPYPRVDQMFKSFWLICNVDLLVALQIL